MYAGPSASRGKSKKSTREDAVAVGDGKKKLQRETKAQRKAGGVSRGRNYDVEELGGFYGRGDGDIAVASDRESSAAEEASDSSSAAEAVPDAAPAAGAARSKVLFAPPARSNDDGGDDELREIEDGLREELRAIATDPGMPLDEQKRCVKQLMAQWHPDKNRHMHAAATRIFQFIQTEVNTILAELSRASDGLAKKQAEKEARQAQRAAEKSAMASAVQAARKEKQALKADKKSRHKQAADDDEEPEVAVQVEEKAQEWSLVIGHGPATTTHLRPYPRSHFSLASTPVQARGEEILVFGGEAYDGKELTFYSDLYRMNLSSAEPDRVLPWEKLYSSVPMIPGPAARSSHQAVVWDKFLYVFGGEWSSRDQKRYRQFNDLWRFDCTAGPGARWELIEAEGAPCARSGHRMASAPGGHAVLFGGFSEDKRRRATYLDDLHALQLSNHSWHVVPIVDDKRVRPHARAGHLLWVAGGTAYVLGGTRPKKKGGDDLEILEDLWRCRMDSVRARWEKLSPQGEGPGKRSGMCQCASGASSPGCRLVFGGVVDLHVPAGSTVASKGQPQSKARDVSLFHGDLFLLNCDAGDGTSPVWSRLWPKPGTGPVPEMDASKLPQNLLSKGGGADAHALVLFGGAAAASCTTERTSAPRGRIAASCVVSGGAFWIFGGSCEAGPRQEVTLDDMWRLELVQHPEERGTVTCREAWECISPLSERATVWFDDSDDSSSDEEAEQEELRKQAGQAILPANNAGGGVLSKKQQKEANHQARMEAKRDKEREKCEEKLDKRALKIQKQREQALAKGKAG
eukprot:gnl/TRDRNA2_/TRDRNA2_135635_c0_seq1.p1 gnl/TRDRNA2_/TRDRNA2_135635_c0~~gnl/TRDRNA2_/TRDRNA2_135635_c0_seq1.p1  ORF type:complete len:802 (-),score=181.83 gnl/TRDRNA2_/TRDRNA2_135635_c0_seq1:111-2516(-)